MKASQFRELSEEELDQKLSDLTDDLFKLRIRHSVAKLENPIRIRELRREIARLKTVMRENRRRMQEKQAGGATPAEAKQ
ncbi:MAG: 50S ribosomal protein L29 [candidate division NC10 bacterium]|nr:50S ribosomal protein L29 [candidate division NC10 bacterium]